MNGFIGVKQTPMIRTYKDYITYRKADKKALGRRRMLYSFKDDIAKFQMLMRRMEYSRNCSNRIISFILRAVTYPRYYRIARLLGFGLFGNNFGPGLKIMHRGTIIVTPKARIGANCKLNAGVQIGPGRGGAPIIGDNCYIGPGAKIFGNIVLGNNIRIGANAVVNKSFPEDNILLVGVPAKAIKKKIALC